MSSIKYKVTYKDYVFKLKTGGFAQKTNYSKKDYDKNIEYLLEKYFEDMQFIIDNRDK